MSTVKENKRFVMGITGASGAVYGRRIVRALLDSGCHVDLVISGHGAQLLRDELGIHEITPDAFGCVNSDRLRVQECSNLHADIASGSTPTDGMVVCPMSMNTLGKAAAGIADNLLLRALQVTLKQRRPLVVVPREMPMSRIDLENCLRLSTAGAIICPAAPAFYTQPRTIGDLVDFVAARVLDLLRVPHDLNVRWSGKSS